MKLEAVIFDKDGVLTDSEKLKAEAWQRTLQTYGVADGFYWYLKNLGPSSYSLAANAQLRFGFDGNPSVIAKQWTDEYRAIEHDVEPIRANLEFLATISRDYKIAIASSMDKATIESEMKQFGYRQFIDACVSGEDVENNKPAPDVYFAAADALGVLPDRCVAIEDSQTGVAAAKAAGMVCIGYKNPLYDSDLTAADIITSKLDQCDFEEIVGKARAARVA